MYLPPMLGDYARIFSVRTLNKSYDILTHFHIIHVYDGEINRLYYIAHTVLAYNVLHAKIVYTVKHVNFLFLHHIHQCKVHTTWYKLTIIARHSTKNIKILQQCSKLAANITNKCSAVAEMGDRLATMDGPKTCVCAHFGGGAGSPSNTMWLGSTSTSMPSYVLIHLAVWPQYTNVTDRTDRQDNSLIP